jgi:hypothetical protein
VAIDRVSTALSTTWKQEAPLIFYVTGGKGVGKHYLADVLAMQLESCSDGKVPLLHISYREAVKSIQEVDVGNSSPPPRLLLDHVMDHPNASILVLSHVEDWDSNVLHTFLESFWQEPLLFSKTIVVLTSNVGKSIIDKTLRRYSGPEQSLPLVELESFLKHEIQEYHKMHKEEEEDHRATLTSTSDSSMVRSEICDP